MEETEQAIVVTKTSRDNLMRDLNEVIGRIRCAIQKDHARECFREHDEAILQLRKIKGDLAGILVDVEELKRTMQGEKNETTL